MVVPERLVVHVEQYIEQKKKEDETKYEKHIADTYGISLEEYRTQCKMLDEANQKRDKEYDNKESITAPGPPLETEEHYVARDFEETIKLVSTGRPVSEDRVEKQRKALEKFGEQKREQNLFDEQKKLFDKIAEQNKKEISKSSDDSYQVTGGGIGEREVENSFFELYPNCLPGRGPLSSVQQDTKSTSVLAAFAPEDELSLQFTRIDLQNLLEEKLTMASEETVPPNEEITKLQKELIQLREKNATLEAAKTKLQKEKTWLSNSFDQVSNGYQELCNVYEKQKGKNSVLVKEITELETKFNASQKKHQQLQKTITIMSTDSYK